MPSECEFFRVGPRGFNLRKLIFWESSSPETTVAPGHLRFVMESGITFELSGDQARRMQDHLDRMTAGPVDPVLPYPPLVADEPGHRAAEDEDVPPNVGEAAEG